MAEKVMPTEIESQPLIASLPELEEQYRAWAHAVEQHHLAHGLTHEFTRQSFRHSRSAFWRGFGSVLCIFPAVVVDTTSVVNSSVQEALFQNWLSVGRDFLSVCSRMTEKSGDSTTTTGSGRPREHK